jgi:hypothetical protein
MSLKSHPKLVLAVLCLSLFAIAGADSNCAKVSDPVSPGDGTGLQASGGGRSDCMKACTRAKNDAKREERDLHRDNVDACDSDPECLREEAARHAARMAEIMRDFHVCREDCHEQGGGGGGQ